MLSRSLQSLKSKSIKGKGLLHLQRVFPCTPDTQGLALGYERVGLAAALYPKGLLRYYCFHKSFFHRKKMPHKGLPSVAIEEPSADEIPAISHPSKVEESASSDFSALDGLGKYNTNLSNSQENSEKK